MTLGAGNGSSNPPKYPSHTCILTEDYYLGIFPVTVLALLKASDTGESFWVIIGLCAIVFVIVQTLQDMVLTPKIMGKAMGMNPAVILLSLSVWGCLLGFIGLVIALPLTMLCFTYYKRFVLKEK